MVIRTKDQYRWEGIDVHPYKEDGTHFKSITRQTIRKVEGNLPIEFRYFEIKSEGHSTLERHDHQHAVLIIKGSGRVLVGEEVHEIGLHDVVHVPPMTWHQFRACNGEDLGFLCIVSNDRDKPRRPQASDLEVLNSKAEVSEFIRV